MNWSLRLTSDVQWLLLSLYVLQKSITLMVCRFRSGHRHRERYSAQGKGWRDLQSDSLHDHLNIFSGVQRRGNTDGASGCPSRIPYIELRKYSSFRFVLKLIRDLCRCIVYRARPIQDWKSLSIRGRRRHRRQCAVRNTYRQNAFSSPHHRRGHAGCAIYHIKTACHWL